MNLITLEKREGRLGEPPLPPATTKLPRNAADGLFTRPSFLEDFDPDGDGCSGRFGDPGLFRNFPE